MGAVVASVVFSAAIALLAPSLSRFELPPKAGPWFYAWQLAEPTWVTRLSAWGSYAVHQLLFWWLLARAQRAREGYSTDVRRLNVLAFALNGGFALLHLGQTHVFYDGLAQDVPTASSFGSVAVLLVWVLLMDNPRRGLFFGKKVPLAKAVTDWARRYHGYYFSWAITYTFWFHPAEGTTGHVAGFLYTLVLMIQGSLFFTRLHVNKWWMLTLEILVVVHGTLVSLDQGNEMWPMFFFGFLGVFVVTQMHGLGLGRVTRFAIGLLYLGGVAFVTVQRGAMTLAEVPRIPVIDYVGVAVLAGLIALGLRIARLVRR
jgi:hypothetical protein